ncbi:NfeD family protein [Tolumonas auensis]|uniref:NfeD family protein n=1 Tax=Tolumonas auensis TaxID=43948 RepID=UPI002AA81DEC|nr:NfeD family protein [Tolumonas auensis]
MHSWAWLSLSDWSYWHWLILGAVLLLLELFGTAGLLLWTGISALLTALMVFVFEPGLFAQWSLFAVFSIATTWFWFRLNKQDKPATEVKTLNQRTTRCIGAQTTLLEDVKLGKSRVRIEDTVWGVLSSETLPAGTAVKVVAAEGTTLIVKALPVHH